LGLLTRNLSAAGAGFLAASHQNQDLKWKNIKKVTFYSSPRTIVLKAGFGEKGIVFCNEDNYGPVSQYVRNMCRDDCNIRDK